MSIRNAIERNRNAFIILVAVIVALCAFWMVRSGGGPSNQSYYYNLQTGEIFAADADLPTPINVSGGAEAVRVHAYACGACSEDDMKVTHLERMSDEAQRMAETFTPTGDPADEEEYQRVMAEGHQVAEPPAAGEQPQWVSIVSAEGQALANAHLQMCGGDTTPDACKP